MLDANDLRMSRQSLTVAGPGAGGIDLLMPMIEGEAHRILQVQFSMEVIEAGTEISVGLSHLLFGSPGTILDVWDDENVWVHHTFGDGPASVMVNTASKAVAGPQRFVVFNNSPATTHRFHVAVWYETERINLVNWANLAYGTSHEP